MCEAEGCCKVALGCWSCNELLSFSWTVGSGWESVARAGCVDALDVSIGGVLPCKVLSWK